MPLDRLSQRFGEIDSNLFFFDFFLLQKRKKLYVELLYKQQQNYMAPHPIEIPYYLCIKVKMKQMEDEYWFSVPKER